MSEVGQSMSITIFLYLLRKSDRIDVLCPEKLTLVQDGSLPFGKQLPVFFIGPFSSQVLLFSRGMTAGVVCLLTKFVPGLHLAP